MDALPPRAVTKAKPDRPAPPNRPDWQRDGADWPNRAASRFCRAAGIEFHVQIMGQGPVLLLLHGTGAATHSWRGLLPILAKNYTLVAPDLPGHGFTGQPDKAGMTRPGMARCVTALLEKLGLQPAYAAGHSAGAAILAEMCIAQQIAPQVLVSLNGAMLPLMFHGVAAPFVGPIAKLFASNPLVPIIFSWQASDGRVVKNLLESTGSRIDAQGEAYYGRLARRSGHAGAALTMMAHWDLQSFTARLPLLKTRLILIAGENDRSIPPTDAARIKTLVPHAEIRLLPGLGHLAHEERPAEIAALIEEVCQ